MFCMIKFVIVVLFIMKELKDMFWKVVDKFCGLMDVF